MPEDVAAAAAAAEDMPSQAGLGFISLRQVFPEDVRLLPASFRERIINRTPQERKWGETMSLLSEIRQIPDAAERCLRETKGLSLPTGVPYVGMGSSYFAPLCLKFAGARIVPEIASEFCNYLAERLPLGVLVSQSGRSTETRWCADLFDKYVAVVNDPSSPLACGKNCTQVVDIRAPEEKFSSTAPYVNTLVALYNGLGFDPAPAVAHLKKNFKEHEAWAREAATRIASRAGRLNGIYVLGSGPNIATAYEAALTLGESTKLPFYAMPLAQYDHGPKEAAKASLVISINVKGPSYERTKKVMETVRGAGAEVITLDETRLDERLSPISLIVPLNFLMHHLGERLGSDPSFSVGSKVTELG